MKTPTDRMMQLMATAGDARPEVSGPAMRAFAAALTVPLRQGVLKGDIVTDLFTPEPLKPGQHAEYPLDLLNPGSEKDFVAYAVPSMGAIPGRFVQGDYLMLTTYEVAASIDFALKFMREANWNVAKRALAVLEASFIRKMNADGWHVVLAAGAGRNLVVYDDQATAGLLSKRLVELMKNIMRRNAGGNSTSVNRGKLTRLYVSPEAQGDIRSWQLADVDDFTRRQIFVADEYGLTNIFNVELRDLDELGESQEFQDYYLNTIGGTLPGSPVKKELVVGVDLQKDDSFVMPIKQEVEIHEDPTYLRRRQASFFGWGEWSFGCLDARRVLLGAL